MEYAVRIRRSVWKNLERLPEEVRDIFEALVEILKYQGPTGPYRWRNYGKLRGSANRYHCHLKTNHAYVACWEYEKETITIEVYYVGSHQSAPY